MAPICRRLDGMPLASELAAAWVGGRPVERMAERLKGSLRILTVGNRAAPPRQQTLQATIDWRHDLLTDAERRLFHRVAVCATGRSLDAAVAVCVGDDLGAADLADWLARLANHWLVQAEVGVAVRAALAEGVGL